MAWRTSAEDEVPAFDVVTSVNFRSEFREIATTDPDVTPGSQVRYFQDTTVEWRGYDYESALNIANTQKATQNGVTITPVGGGGYNVIRTITTDITNEEE